MIKIFRGEGRGGDTFKTPSPYEQLLPLPTPCFKMFFWKNPSMTPPHFKHPSLLPPPHPPPLPPKNFDHTLSSHFALWSFSKFIRWKLDKICLFLTLLKNNQTKKHGEMCKSTNLHSQLYQLSPCFCCFS